jgi:hypothetical protein
MSFFKNVFGGFSPVYRNWTPEGDEGGGGGSGGAGDKGKDGDKGGVEKKFAGKYKTAEDLEKGYTDLEVQQGKSSKRIKELEAENKRHEQAGKKHEDTDAGKKTETGKAQKAYREFVDNSDPDELSGRDLVKWLEKRDELRDDARTEREAEKKASHSKTSEEASKAALKEIMETDTRRLMKIKTYKKDELEGLIDWGDEHGCGSLTEAHYAREHETLTKQVKDKDAEIADLKKKVEQKERHFPGLRRGEKSTEDDKGDKPPIVNRRLHMRGRLGRAYDDSKLNESHNRMMEELTGKKGV